MAITGLRPVVETAPPVLNDAVEVAVEALGMLGLVKDRDTVTESVRTDFMRNAGLMVNNPGELYVQLPRSVITLGRMVAALDGATYGKAQREYPQTYVWHDLWTPGTTSGSVTAEELDNLAPGETAQWQAHGRLALHNPAGSPHEPLLHFLGQPFDVKYAKRGEQTQLEALAAAQSQFEIAHPDFNLRALNAKAVAMLALQRRITGEPMPMDWGVMYDATLGRKFVGGYSIVGYMSSADGRLKLVGWNGRLGMGDGIGLSAGPNV